MSSRSYRPCTWASTSLQPTAVDTSAATSVIPSAAGSCLGARSTTTTSAPSDARDAAMAAPIPLAPPVTSATRPDNSPLMMRPVRLASRTASQAQLSGRPRTTALHLASSRWHPPGFELLRLLIDHLRPSSEAYPSRIILLSPANALPASIRAVALPVTERFAADRAYALRVDDLRADWLGRVGVVVGSRQALFSDA